jgi:hypothetical protein
MGRKRKDRLTSDFCRAITASTNGAQPMFTVKIDAVHLTKVLAILGTDKGAAWLPGFTRFCVKVDMAGLDKLIAAGIEI